MKKFAISLIVALATASGNAKEWTDSERLMLGASTAALVADWGQTRDIVLDKKYIPATNNGLTWTTARTDYAHYETNPILGKHPSMAKVNIYFTAAIAGNYLIADNLDDHRIHWLAGVTVVELLQVIANKRMGISWRF